MTVMADILIVLGKANKLMKYVEEKTLLEFDEKIRSGWNWLICHFTQLKKDTPAIYALTLLQICWD